MIPFSAVVFDFDGLILDTESAEFASWSAEFERHGVTLDFHEWEKCVGTGPDGWDVYQHLESLIGPYDKGVVAVERMEVFQQILGEVPTPQPGAVELIEALVAQKVNLAIASSSTFAWVDGYLRRLGLRHAFPHLVTRDLVGAAKPSPLSYQTAYKLLGVEPKTALAIEDSPNGIAAAKEAGLTCWCVPNPLTARMDLSGADRQFDSLVELCAALFSD